MISNPARRIGGNMLILSQSGALLIEFSKPMKYSVDPAGKVFAAFVEGHSELLGVYDVKEHAKHVIGQMAAAYIEGRRMFYMPDAVEVRSELMNRHCKPVRITGAGNSHGGT